MCNFKRIMGLVAFSAGLLILSAAAGEVRTPSQQPEQKPKIDLYGDPLPPGAIARLGTVRYRADGVTLGFLPDSRTLVIPATRSEGPRIQFWDAVSGVLQREIVVDASSLLSSAMSRDGKLIALSVYLPHKDDELTPGEVQIWDLATGKKVKTLKRSGEDVNHSAVAFSPDNKLLFSIGKDEMVNVEEIDSGKEILRYKFPKGVKGAILGGSIGSSPDGTVVAVGCPDAFFLWKWQSNEKPLELKNPDRQRRAWTFSPDGKLFLQCGKEMRIWDVASGKLVHTLKPSLKGYYFANVSYTPDGKTLFLTHWNGDDGKLEVWDPATWEFKHRMDPFYVGHVHTSPDGRLLAGNAGHLRVWDQIAKKELSIYDGHRHGVSPLATFGDLVVTASQEDTIRVWDVKSGKLKTKITHGKWVRGLALSPDGTKLVSSSQDDAVRLWDVATGEPLNKLPIPGRVGNRRAFTFTPDGKYFLSYGDDWCLRKWETATGKAVLEHWITPDGKNKAPDDPDKKKPFSPEDIFNRLEVGGFSTDGKSLALIKPPEVGKSSREIRLFDVATGALRYTLNLQARFDGPTVFSPDNRLMLVSTTGNPITIKLPDGRTRGTFEKEHFVYLWELSTRAVRMKLVLPGQNSSPMAFSPDSKLFAAGTTDVPASIRLWDSGTGKELPPITGFRGKPWSLAFTSDSTSLISGMDDTTALVWELKKR